MESCEFGSQENKKINFFLNLYH